MRIYTLQPAPVTDHITDDGTELQRLPYPYHVDEEGNVQRQDFWKGDPSGIIGFQNRADVQRVNLLWDDFVAGDPNAAVGKYMVMVDSKGTFATYTIPVESVSVIEIPETVEGQSR